MKAEGVSFRHAVDLLQNDYRPLVAHGRRPKQATVRKLTALVVFVYDGGPATTVPHLSGLIDVTTLKSNCDAERAGVVNLRKMTITPLPMRSYRRSITRCSSMHIPGNTANLHRMDSRPFCRSRVTPWRSGANARCATGARR